MQASPARFARVKKAAREKKGSLFGDAEKIRAQGGAARPTALFAGIPPPGQSRLSAG
jgi:hypothetical protein